MRWWWYRQPPSPTNVRLRIPDGTEIPLELVYEGKERGCHMWKAVLRVPLMEGKAELLCDELPGRTGIRVEVIA